MSARPRAGRFCRGWAAALAIAILGTAAAGAPAAELSDSQVLALLTADSPSDIAIRHGLEFVNAHQNADGSFAPGPLVAVTGLCVMANLSSGVVPDATTAGARVRHALEWLLTAQDPSGYFGSKDGSRMYGHGIATLALGEALGTGRDEEFDARLRSSLTRAVQVTINAARVLKSPAFSGGWRYSPEDVTSDMSLTGWQLMSLHAAAQAGIAVPDEIISAAVDFARRMTTNAGLVGYDHAGDDHAPLRGLSMLCFAIGQHGSDPQVGLIAERVRADPLAWQGSWMFYRAYYDAVGMSRAAPEIWESYGPLLEKVLTDHQNADGSWPNPPGDDEGSQGPVYMTAMAVLALSVHRHLLPVYQR